jgi:hypothetical protein
MATLPNIPANSAVTVGVTRRSGRRRVQHQAACADRQPDPRELPPREADRRGDAAGDHAA